MSRLPGQFDEDDNLNTVVELRIPVVGTIKDSPYLSEGDVGTGTLILSIEVDGYFDHAESAVEYAVEKLQGALTELLGEK